MRLIDADELKIIPYSAFDVMPVCDISSAPTVEAIPIEWLKELQTKYLEAECFLSVCVVNEILNLWRKENEINRP